MNGLSTLVIDENGKLSTARCGFWLVLIFTLILLALVGFDAMDLPAAGYTLLGTIFTFVTVWAAGPRMAAYLSPAIGKATDAIRATANATVSTRALVFIVRPPRPGGSWPKSPLPSR